MFPDLRNWTFFARSQNLLSVGFSLGILLIIAIDGQRNVYKNQSPYYALYTLRLDSLENLMLGTLEALDSNEAFTNAQKAEFLKTLHKVRLAIKNMDFWMRYLDPVQYRKIHGALQIEWETEAHEKWEAPYKRTGGGVLLAEEYLDQDAFHMDSLKSLLQLACSGIAAFRQDSNTRRLQHPETFYFANRLFLLNLSAIFTTGFECPDSHRILPELHAMLLGTKDIYAAFDNSFPEYKLPASYMAKFDDMLHFVEHASPDWLQFNHFEFIRSFVNPLYAENSRLIEHYRFLSRSFVDFSLNNAPVSIFDKNLYQAQEVAGVFKRVHSDSIKRELRDFGKLLFYDPILSGNNERSCASCHIPQQFFADTTVRTPLAFDKLHRLKRNAPTLLNVRYNHLLMWDGKHLGLAEQLQAVHQNPEEMFGDALQTMKKIRSCRSYKETLERLAAWSSQKEAGFEHIVSALIFYYSSFDTARSDLDLAMEQKKDLEPDQIAGFNLFMGKAKCGTCHFPPHFNGVKPPYTNNEFEALGVPEDDSFTKISPDSGRYRILPVAEMVGAFRTGSLRNIQRTKPYMHNGAFNSIDQIISFYNFGGGAGRGLQIANQTLVSDSLKLSDMEHMQLLRFLECLNEHILLEPKPDALPMSSNKLLNKRRVGGVY